jgi:multidrug efflux pump
MFMGGGQVSQRLRRAAHRGLGRARRTTQELARELLPKLMALPGVSVFPVTPPSLGQGFRERPLNFVIVSGDSYENMARAAQAMMAEMQKNPGIVQPDIDLQLNKPEIFIDVDRARAADMGVSVDAVARTVETMLGGRVVTRYKRDAEQYDVLVQTEAGGRATPEDIEKIFVRGRNDTMVPLSSLVKVREAVSPRELNHFNQRRSVTITANLAPGLFAGRGAAFMDETAAGAAAGLRHRAERRQPRVPRLQRARWAWSSCWRCCSSSWCWRRSSRASSTRSSSCCRCRCRWWARWLALQ